MSLIFLIMFLMSKLLLSNGYESFKILIVYFLLIRLIPNFYEMYACIHNNILFIIFSYNPKLKK
jgi:hypothetical protein